MAGIDCTYINKTQFRAILDWVLFLNPLQKEKLPHIKCDLKDFEEREANVLWKKTEEQDKWLILNCKLDFIQERIIEQNGIEFKYKVLYEKYKEEAIEELSEQGFDPSFGARPLRRLIQEKVTDAIANFLLTGKVSRRDVVILEKGGTIRVEKRS